MAENAEEQPETEQAGEKVTDGAEHGDVAPQWGHFGMDGEGGADDEGGDDDGEGEAVGGAFEGLGGGLEAFVVEVDARAAGADLGDDATHFPRDFARGCAEFPGHIEGVGEDTARAQALESGALHEGFGQGDEVERGVHAPDEFLGDAEGFEHHDEIGGETETVATGELEEIAHESRELEFAGGPVEMPVHEFGDFGLEGSLGRFEFVIGEAKEGGGGMAFVAAGDAPDQVDEGFACLLIEETHLAEVEETHALIGQDQDVARVWIRVEEAV